MTSIQYVPFSVYDAPVTYKEAGGDGFKQVLSVVVPLLIPIAAPFIASAIGLSGALSGVLGSAIGTGVANAATGAVMGGLNAAATGGSVEEGALFGGLGGFGGGLGQGAGAAEGAVNAGSKAAEIAANGSKAFLPSSATPSFMPNPTGGLALPGGGQVGLFGNKPQLGGIINNAAASAPPGQGVMAALQRMGGAVIQRMGGTERAIATITQMALAGTRNAEMQEAIDARRAELAAAQQQNQRLFDQRLATSNRILGEAEYYNPEQGGTQAAADYTMRVNNEEEEALRDLAGRGGYNTGRREAISRRAGLARGRGAASSFLEGAQNAEERRGQRRMEALQWLPAEAPNNTASQAALDEMRDRATGRRDEQYGQAFGFATADPYTPNEDEQWDRVGLWTGR